MPARFIGVLPREAKGRDPGHSWLVQSNGQRDAHLTHHLQTFLCEIAPAHFREGQYSHQDSCTHVFISAAKSCVLEDSK